MSRRRAGHLKHSACRLLSSFLFARLELSGCLSITDAYLERARELGDEALVRGRGDEGAELPWHLLLASNAPYQPEGACTAIFWAQLISHTCAHNNTHTHVHARTHTWETSACASLWLPILHVII